MEELKSNYIKTSYGNYPQ